MSTASKARDGEVGIEEFEPQAWRAHSFSERARIAARFYILQGMAIPWPAYVVHAVKLAVFVAGWMFFASFTPGLGSPATLTTWMFEPMAFQKAFVWACLFEVLGFGCMSGPLGLKIWPPFTAFLYFARPGTTKLAPFPDAPVIGGATRGWYDVLVYLGFVASLVRVLAQPEIAPAHLYPVIVLLPLAALGDRTVPLAARWEHHFAMIVCFALAGNWIAAAKWVQLGIWFWAGVSKLTRAFGYVVPIMTANNPLLKAPGLRRRLFRGFPDDLHPSTLAKAMAHGGTFLEFAAPLTLLFVNGPGPLQWLGVFFFLMLHGFILSNMPLGAVFEWNVLSVYAGFFLFVGFPETSLFDVGSAPMTMFLLANCLVLPLVGNLFPRKVSFLIAMRYYAGNWAWNAWLFRTGSMEKLDRLKRAAQLLPLQQKRFLAPLEATQSDASFLAFRTLHLQGRVLGKLLPQATDGKGFSEYAFVDGEPVAGSLIGWNFGEGHLADESLVRAIQGQCDFEPGELRVICVESQPLLGSTLHWRIMDAACGVMDEGHVELDELAQRAPWDYG